MLFLYGPKKNHIKQNNKNNLERERVNFVAINCELQTGLISATKLLSP